MLKEIKLTFEKREDGLYWVRISLNGRDVKRMNVEAKNEEILYKKVMEYMSKMTKI